MVSAMVRPNRDARLKGLSRSEPFISGFNPVSNSVADEVNQGIGNMLDDVVVELRLGAFESQFHLLFRSLGSVASLSLIHI